MELKKLHVRLATHSIPKLEYVSASLYFFIVLNLTHLMREIYRALCLIGFNNLDRVTGAVVLRSGLTITQLQQETTIGCTDCVFCHRSGNTKTTWRLNLKNHIHICHIVFRWWQLSRNFMLCLRYNYLRSQPLFKYHAVSAMCSVRLQKRR